MSTPAQITTWCQDEGPDDRESLLPSAYGAGILMQDNRRRGRLVHGSWNLSARRWTRRHSLPRDDVIHDHHPRNSLEIRFPKDGTGLEEKKGE